MKIKSIVNVITNSSDETFIIKTNESIEEINEWLSENVRGWCDLQRVDSVKSPIISEIVDGFDYLYDSKDINSIKKYHIEQVFCSVERGTYNVTKEELEIRANLCDKWLIFLAENRSLINKIARKRKKESWVYDCYRLPKIDEIYLEAITLNNGNVIYDVYPYYIKYIDKLIPIYISHLFDSDWLLWIYEENNSYSFKTISQNQITEKVWEKSKFTFTKEKPEDWNESNTVKYDELSIGEFQVHQNRNCFKFRFNLQNLLKILHI